MRRSFSPVCRVLALPLFPLLPVLFAALACKNSPPAPATNETAKSATPPASAAAMRTDAAVVEAADLTPTPPPAPKFELKMIDAGQEPKRLLRYAFHTGENEVMTMSMASSVTVQMGPSKQNATLPSTTMKLRIEPQTVSPEGDLHYTFAFISATATPTGQAPPDVMAKLKQAMDAMKGLSGSATVNSSGVTRDPKIELPSGDAPPEIQQIVEQVRSVITDFSATLPSEPVGAGAKWVRTMTQTGGPLPNSTTNETYQLKSITKNVVAMDVEMAQTIPKQPAPNVPPGAEVQVESATQGKGHLTVDLDHLVPKSDMALTTTMTATQTAPTPMTQKVVTKTTMKVQGGKN